MICDIMGSRFIEDRKALQYKLLQMLEEGNRLFSDIIACPFAITSGDEWEGLLKPGCPYHKVIDYFNTKLGSARFYCGIGKGELTVDDFTLSANQLDGPSFYLARKAIEIAKELQCPLIYIEKEGSFKNI